MTVGFGPRHFRGEKPILCDKLKGSYGHPVGPLFGICEAKVKVVARRSLEAKLPRSVV